MSDKEVRAAIEGGADTVEAVIKACCAGDDCGSCHDLIEEMIEDRLDAKPRHLPVVRGRAA